MVKHSTKTKKLLRLSPKSKKKHSKSKESNTMREMESQGACHMFNNEKLPNGFTDKERNELKQAFDLFDKNHDGKISCEELGCVLRTLGLEYTQPEIEEMIKNADKNENGFVEYDEFLCLMKRWTANHAARAEMDDKAKETFKVFDMDGNGYIDKHELRYVMRRLGENLTEEDTKAMFQLADLNGDGLIDFEEFSKLMVGLSFPLIPKECLSGEATPQCSSRDSSI